MKATDYINKILNEEASGFYVRDTLVRYDDLNKLSPKKQAKIMELKNEFDKLGYIDVRTQIGPDQSARMTSRDKSSIKSKMFKAWEIEDEIKQLMKSDEQVSDEEKTERIKELKGKILQKERYIETINGLGITSHMKNDPAKLKPKYQTIINGETEDLNKFKEELNILEKQK